MDTSPDRARASAHRNSADHWPQTARLWHQLGPPLRPMPEDLHFLWDAVQEWGRDRGAPRVLLLGVTPELYHLPWPKGTDFLAVDRTQAMIDRVWPGPKEAARCMNWLDLNLPDGSRDVVLCDGGLPLLAYPEEQRQLPRIVQSILGDKGLCILRLYVPPRRREAPDAVLKDLLEGRIPNLNILKLRFSMSLQENASDGVELAAVWRALHEAAPDLEALASRIGWPVEHMLVINSYRDSTDRFHFATVDEVADLFCKSPGGFVLRRVHVPAYELGERCPTLVLQRSSSARSGAHR